MIQIKIYINQKKWRPRATKTRKWEIFFVLKEIDMR